MSDIPMCRPGTEILMDRDCHFDKDLTYRLPERIAQELIDNGYGHSVSANDANRLFSLSFNPIGERYYGPHCLCAPNEDQIKPWVIYSWVHQYQGTQTMRNYHLFRGANGAYYDSNSLSITDLDGKNIIVPYVFRGTSVHCIFGAMSKADKIRFRENYMFQVYVKSPRRYGKNWEGFRILTELPMILMPEESFVDKRIENDTAPGHNPLFNEYPMCLCMDDKVDALLIGEPFLLSPKGKGLHVLIALQGTLETRL